MSLLALGSAAHSNQLDELVSASTALANQIDRGIMLTGAAMSYANTGTGLSDGTLSETAHISTAQLEAYNNALAGMSTYLPYGSVQNRLEEMAQQELDLLDQAVDVFTDVVVDLSTTIQVSEMAQEASTPDEESAVQEFVVDNAEMLQVTQEEVDTFNQSADDIENHSNSAASFIAVSANQEAVDFLQQGAETNNANADLATVSYNANQQWVKMQWAGTNNATAVYLNGQNYGLDLYLSEADILVAGAESEYYLTGPTALGYKCFMTFEDCE